MGGVRAEMIEVFGDIWEYKAAVVCIPTNGVATRDKAGVPSGVMGAGVALEAKQRYPGIEKLLGKSLRRYGNKCVAWADPYPPICFFPTKCHWRAKADPDLIVKSAQELSAIAGRFPDWVFVLPRPGCGNGGLAWAEVKPLIEGILPDNVHVIERRNDES